MSRVEEGLWESYLLILQARTPPPAEWLASVELSAESFLQQILNHFTVVLFSTLDRCLLVTNHVLALGLHDRLASHAAIRKELASVDGVAEQKFAELETAVRPLSDARHFFAHRGEPRKIKLFSEVARAKKILDAWGAPPAGIAFNEAGARAQILGQMESDLGSIRPRATAALDSLSPFYASRLAFLGGVDHPSPEERQRAAAVMRYFKGGERPRFMEAG
ncbi:MAG: hypothetical protein NT125_08290 [Candidatus Bipolaricaulota bacterium]|nr:hypothetical protein [Candidatus Bipolaricaulota bacterium]